MVKRNVMERLIGVGLDAQRQRAEYKRSDAWLQESIPFDYSHHLNEKNRIRAHKLLTTLDLQGGYKEKQKQIDCEILLANLFNQTRRPIQVSLNQSDWKYTRYNKSSYFTVALIYMLEGLNYIEMKKGYNLEEGSRMTRIWATEKLLEYCPEYNTAIIYKPNELVILRDNKGKLKEYKDTAETWRIRTILKRVNEVNSNADIRYWDSKLNAFLLAIFNEKFTWYGRLHTKGYRHYQGFDEEERAEILINGENVIELDYRGLHPNLLYAGEGIQCRRDPYSVIDSRPEVRPFLKEILLCMLNAKDFTTAEKAANYWLYHNTTEKEIMAGIGITKARPLMELFIEAHKPISHHFCKGKDTGLRIMNKDSKIALDVINHFAKLNIPILSIHDSFIVQEQYRDELYNVMKTTYTKHTGFDIKVK